MSKFNDYFSRLDNYISCMLIVRRMLNEKVISEETYKLMENELAKEFAVKKSLKRADFRIN